MLSIESKMQLRLQNSNIVLVVLAGLSGARKQAFISTFQGVAGTSTIFILKISISLELEIMERHMMRQIRADSISRCCQQVLILLVF